MASAWGGAWGSAWGDSWGVIAVPSQSMPISGGYIRKRKRPVAEVLAPLLDPEKEKRRKRQKEEEELIALGVL